ncbi:MAG: RlmE family RNA methyltransferase [Acidiferrobacterales bacterium]
MSTTRRKDAWLQAHKRDLFVRRAHKEGYRSRAVYKLMEIDSRYRLFRPGIRVIDLGASPGGWSQYARQRVGASGRVLAQDILAMEPLPSVEFICGDIADPAVLDLLLERLGGSPADLVMSDIAPNTSGERIIDQARATALAQRVLVVAATTLKRGGQVVLKAFQGEGFSAVRAAMQDSFDKVLTYKPQASRSKSREIYLLGRGFVADPGSVVTRERS